MRRGVATDHSRCAREQGHLRHERVGEALGFVGDDAPDHALLANRAEQIGDAVKSEGALREAAFVVHIKLFSEYLVIHMIGQHVKRDAQHAARARTCQRAVAFIRNRGQAAIGAQLVGSGGQIGGAVDQRAIEVEENG